MMPDRRVGSTYQNMILPGNSKQYPPVCSLWDHHCTTAVQKGFVKNQVNPLAWPYQRFCFFSIHTQDIIGKNTGSIDNHFGRNSVFLVFFKIHTHYPVYFAVMLK